MIDLDQTEIRSEAPDGSLARAGAALADWSARWFPDSFVFALLAVIIVFGAGLLLGSSMGDLAKYYGQGFWSLIPFTMQMAMIIIGGYVVATSPPVHRLICWLASIPRTPRGAIAFVAFFSLATSLISWGLSLIFSGLLTREVVKNIRGIDYRAIGAAAFLGFTTVGGLGLSSTVGLLMATPSSIPPQLLAITGPIPLSQTIFSWQSLTIVIVILVTSITIAYLSAPKHSSMTAESFGVTDGVVSPSVAKATEQTLEKSRERRTPGEMLENLPFLSILIAILGLAYLVQVFATRGVAAALDLNTYNFLFLMTGLLLHWRPRSFIAAVQDSVPATSGVLIMFPFYAGIMGVVAGSPIARDLARFFVHISTHNSFPVVVAIYTFVLGLFVPSGGSKWVIEAPYISQAGKELQIPLNWVVQIYNASQPLPNWINPFFMLPLLGILKVKARDIVGFGLLQLASSGLLVLFLTWFLARTFH